MKKLLIALIPLSLLACTTQLPVTEARVDRAAPGATSLEGIYYFLPKTAIRVEVTADKIIEKTGPFYRYSQRYLNLSEVITEDSEAWQIRSASITTAGIPDAERRFRITAQGAPAAAAVSLTPDGILKGLNLFMDLPFQAPFHSDFSPSTASSRAVTFDDVPYTEEQLQKTSTAAMAEEVAKEIYRLRNNRTRIVESEAQLLPPDEGAYHIVLQELEKQENKFLSLFKGKRETQTITKTFTFIPDTLKEGNQVLFRFSAQNGFLEPLDVSGTPVYIDINADDKSTDEKIITPGEKEEMPRGLVYCIPSAAKVKVIDRTVLLAESRVQLAQFGKLHRLPASLVNNPSTIVVADPATGGIMKIMTGSRFSNK